MDSWYHISGFLRKEVRVDVLVILDALFGVQQYSVQTVQAVSTESERILHLFH